MRQPASRRGRPAGRPDRAAWLPRATAQALRFTPPDPQPGSYPIDSGQAEIQMDADRVGGWILTLDGVLSSYVALDDPTHLEFEYTRWIGDLLDSLEPTGVPLRVLHLGGAACTLAVYVEITHPGSRQSIVEIDGTLIDLVRAQFGIRSSRRFRLVHDDALRALQQTPDGTIDVIIRDAFVGRNTPAHLEDDGLMRESTRVLGPRGIYISNVADRPGMELTRRELRALVSALDLRPQTSHTHSMAFVTDPSVLRGRRYGNVIVAASRDPLPIAGWMRRTVRAGLPARVVHGERLAQYL
ncbi:spermidine synthase [Antricoccus suffuscus]|uniref:spermidine synthase n=1 Tax=Antricoccus suffuscus TaxID=1629062 RepID=UPI0014766860|nr:fused MFS/spermidine synthase [Antricoccus suffuscus]